MESFFYIFNSLALDMRTLKFLTLSFIGFFGVMYVLYVSYIYCNQADMVFKKHSLAKNYVFHFDSRFKEIQIKSFDGKLQHGILFPTSNPKGLIFYLHGNAGALDSWGAISKIYTRLGYDFFILDYRGFGKSEGNVVNENQVIQDVKIVYDSVSKAYSKKVIIGYSIGTGIAASLASSRKNAMLILKAPYDNFLKYSDARAPYFPDFLKKFAFETDAYLATIKTPIYIFHGNNDRLIPLENSIRLKKLLKPTDSLFVLKNQEHIGINVNAEYQKKLGTLLQ